MNSIPREWRLEPHYEPGLYWFSREARPFELLREEIPAKESEEYPGWYFLQRGDSMRIVDSLEEALAALKSRLKHWKMKDLLGQPAPIEASGAAHKQMVIELLDEDYLDEDDLEPLDLLEDDEGFEEEEEEQDWEEIAVGMVSLEGNRLTVGFWSHTFDENTKVIGVAYEEASFEDKEKRYYLSPRRSHDRT